MNTHRPSVEIPTVTVSEALARLRAGRSPAWLDVRSEGEFADGAIPGFQNAPLLTDPERHEIGLVYKERGQAAAIELGWERLAPQRAARIARWQALASESPLGEAWIACWRGGLRSKITCQLLADSGVACRQIEGGYKALRRHLLEALRAPFPPMVVLAGYTGGGKTDLLTELAGSEVPVPVVDLEGLARHRGSAFGHFLTGSQPAQATFENRLALGILDHPGGFVLEDESIWIGSVSLPHVFRVAMTASPLVILETPLAERIQRVFDAYVRAPLAEGVAVAEIERSMFASLTMVRARLGGELFSKVEPLIRAGFSAGGEARLEDHAEWIGILLAKYYDRRYENALKRESRDVTFRGGYEECRQWIRERFASPKP